MCLCWARMSTQWANVLMEMRQIEVLQMEALEMEAIQPVLHAAYQLAYKSKYINT